MGAQVGTDSPAVIERLQRAANEHDLEALVACMDNEYHSEQPAHPDRTFRGSDQVRKNWSALFGGIRDFRADVLRSASDGDTAWVEWHWQGTKADGTPLDEIGVTIFGVRDDRIVWGRLYLEEIEQAGSDIDEVVKEMAEGSPQES